MVKKVLPSVVEAPTPGSTNTRVRVHQLVQELTCRLTAAVGQAGLFLSSITVLWPSVRTRIARMVAHEQHSSSSTSSGSSPTTAAKYQRHHSVLTGGLRRAHQTAYDTSPAPCVPGQNARCAPGKLPPICISYKGSGRFRRLAQ